MSSKFQSFLSFRENPGFTTSNSKMKEVIDSYTFIEYSEQNESEINFKIEENIKESKVLIISHYEENEFHYFIVSFKRTILSIKETRIKMLQKLLSKKEKLGICFLFNTKELFDYINVKSNETTIKYYEIKNEENFENEIEKINACFFNKKSENIHGILQIIKSSISGFLIKQSYYSYDRLNSFIKRTNDKIKPKEIKQNEIIELRVIETGSESIIILYYHIEYEKLVVIKKYHSYYSEKEKLLKREIQNYEEINHPFIPKLYGTIQYDNQSYPVIEFINGNTSLDTDFSQFSKTEIYEIILQMLLVSHYLHIKHFIYRDLKPNNAIIDANKTLVLIDFDRMIKDDYIYNEVAETADFSSSFAAPEINSIDITNKCDVYSIGKMIDFIMNKSNIKSYEKAKLFQIYKKCINSKIESRPKSSELISDIIFFIIENNIININKFIHYLLFASNQNIPESQYILGLIYDEGQCIPQDINKSIYYYSLAANQNHSVSQYNLGVIYYEGKYISRDINKSIYYFSLAANQNDPQAQYNLGIIYFFGQYISRDMNKAVYYFSLAANHNIPQAQYNLGLIYYEGKYISRDINKSIYYYSLSASQNFPEAQYNLGLIYEIGHYVPQNINKSIYYYSLAANQNYPKAQYNLGLIYYLGQYIQRDINKSIYYFTLAAKQNYSEAQFLLGIIYEEGINISRDINKSIYYYTLAANQNHQNAQYNIGLLYYNGQYIFRDISKAFKYLSLAANQNDSYAQYALGFVYWHGEYFPKDINKSIYYFTLAANQNHPESQYMLGLFYYYGGYIPQDINLSIYYFSLAANQNHPESQYMLGLIYYKGQYISRDINKSIYYYSLAANQNYPKAQYNLGLIYYRGIDIKQDRKKGIYWIAQSSKNDNIKAHFALGFLYHDGKYIKRNIEESIKYYKKASSFNYKYAKNNLGIIYKNHFEKKYDYTVYFEEAIRQKNDPVSMYNLSHSYIYEYQDEKLTNKSIELLIKSSNLNFKPSTELLCILILKKFIFKQKNDKNNEKNNKNELKDIENIDQIISKFIVNTKELKHSIINTIQELHLYDESILKYFYHKYEEIEFIYDLFLNPIYVQYLHKEKKKPKYKKSKKEYNITSDFYEGFGHDIY